MRSHERALWIPRARIMDAMVRVVSEHGYTRASVDSVSARARVSRDTFAEIFDGVDECLLAVLDEGAAHAYALISRSFDHEESWLEGARGALAAVLLSFDSDPALAHVLLVETSAGGVAAHARREQHVLSFTSLIEARWKPSKDLRAYPPITAAVMTSLLGVLQAHLVAGRSEPLIAMLGPLMGILTAPYLDPNLIAREIQRGEELARSASIVKRRSRQPPLVSHGVPVPAVIRDPRAHRARQSLLYIAAHPEASNRQIARAIGIKRDTQISTLLTRLHHADLLIKKPSRPGEANAWTLSAYGQQAASALRLISA